MRLFRLNKSVLSFKNDPDRFLNGLTSNSLDRPHNAFLSVHGRIVATFSQIKVGQDELWVVLEASFVDVLRAHLDRYLRLSRVQLDALKKNVFFDLSGLSGPAAGIGWVEVPQKKGMLVITGDEYQADVTEKDFTLFRLINHIPVQGVDYRDEFVLNVSESDLVSYTKGCFLGQEPVAKVHNRSRPTWRLVVQYEDESSGDEKRRMTSKTIDPNSGRTMGFVFKRQV